MNVIVCTHMYPTEDERTSDNHTFALRNLIESAQNHGANIRHIVRFMPIATPSGISWPRTVTAGHLEVVDVPRIGIKSHFSSQLTRLVMARSTCIEPPDVAVCHMTTNFLSAHRIFQKPRTKLIYVVHSSDLAESRLLFCLQSADAVFCRSEALRKRLASAYGFNANGVVYSGVCASEYGDPQRDCSSKRVKIVMATRLIPLRNVGSTLTALSMLRNELEFDVDIYGDGELYEQIHQLIGELQLHDAVRMHGFRPRSEVLLAMRSAHMFIMPSAPETFGLAYLEAMAQGCVVVGHQGWGIDGIVQDGVNGYLVNSPAPSCIAEKILSYMNSGARQAMHVTSFQTAKQFTADNAGRNYAEMIKEFRA